VPRTRKNQDLCIVCVPALLKIITVSQRIPPGIATLPASRSLGNSCSSSAPALPTPSLPQVQPITVDLTALPRDLDALSLQSLLGILRRYGLRRAFCTAQVPAVLSSWPRSLDSGVHFHRISLTMCCRSRNLRTRDSRTRNLPVIASARRLSCEASHLDSIRPVDAHGC
jgi:hypothetical protein